MKTLITGSTCAVDLPETGVYHFRLPIPGVKALSVICNRSVEVRTVRVLKTGFKPKILMISRGDAVCWTWRETGQHIIYEVSNNGERLPLVKGGFYSGPKRNQDSGFLHRFEKPGVFYYASEGISEDCIGTIVVLDVPDVVEIPPQTQDLMTAGVPIVLKQLDVICWSFLNLVSDDLELRFYANGSWQMMPDPFNAAVPNKHDKDSVVMIKRRSLNRSMAIQGIFHYASKSFHVASPQHVATEPGIVTILVDPPSPCSSIIYVQNKQGFIPSKITVRLGESLLFDWRRGESTPFPAPSSETHNIFLVANYSSSTPMAAVNADKHFMHSGQPVADSTFLTTFTTIGTFTFASQGAPGLACEVVVLEDPLVLQPPQFLPTDMERAVLDQGKIVYLRTVDDNVDIYYTMDGSLPHPAYTSKSLKYSPIKGILLTEPGTVIIRAISVRSDCLWSEISTSRLWIIAPLRDWVTRRPSMLPDEEVEEEESETSDNMDEERRLLEEESAKWRTLIVNLRAFPSTQAGVGEIIWQISSDQNQESIIEYFVVSSFFSIFYFFLFNFNINVVNGQQYFLFWSFAIQYQRGQCLWTYWRQILHDHC